MIEYDKIINGLNEVEYEHTDMLKLVIENKELFVKKYNVDIEKLELIWKTNKSIFNLIKIARESVLLGVQTLILKESVDFSKIMDGCTTNHPALEIIENSLYKGIAKKYIMYLRKWVYDKIIDDTYEEIKGLSVSVEIINQRKNLYYEKIKNEYEILD